MLGIPYNKMVLGLPWYGYDYPCTTYDTEVSKCCCDHLVNAAVVECY